jgi:hypothetical protein
VSRTCECCFALALFSDIAANPATSDPGLSLIIVFDEWQRRYDHARGGPVFVGKPYLDVVEFASRCEWKWGQFVRINDEVAGLFADQFIGLISQGPLRRDKNKLTL